MPVCKLCKGEKPNREMVVWGGSVTAKCLVCRAEEKATSRLAKKDGSPPTTELPGDLALELTVEAGSGFRAAIDGEKLVIDQDNPSRPETPDNLTLSKSEVFVLFMKFANWAGVKFVTN